MGKSLIQKEFEAKDKKQRWEREKKVLLDEYGVDKEIKELLEEFAPKGKKVEASKFFTMFLLVNFILVEGFVGVIAWRSFDLASSMGVSPDFSALYGIIATIIGETITFLIYSVKSMKENTVGGVVYESMIRNGDGK